MLALPLLQLDTKAARNAFATVVPRLGRTSDGEFARTLLTQAIRRIDCTAWIDAVDWTTDVGADRQLRMLVRTAWKRALDPDSPSGPNTANREALATAARDAGVDLTGPDDVPEELAEADPPTTEDEAEGLAQLLSIAEAFIDEGLLGSAATAEALRPAVLEWIRSPLPTHTVQQAQSRHRNLLRAQTRHMLPVVAFVTQDAVGAAEIATAASEDFAGRVEDQHRLRVHALAAGGRPVADEVTPEQVSEALGVRGSEAHDLVADWIRLGLPTVAQIRVALDDHELAHGKRVAAVADALRHWGESVDPAQVAALAGWAAADHELADWFYTAPDPARVDPERLTELLVDAWDRIRINKERRRVLDVWLWTHHVLEAQRKGLIEAILLKYLEEAETNKTAASWAPRFAPLAADPPHGTIGKLRDAVMRLRDSDRWEAIHAAYAGVGLLEPKAKPRGIKGLLQR